MPSEILFYDLSIQSPVRSNKCFAPNALPVRYALNYKRLPYKTIWLEIYEIEPTAKKIGAKATKTRSNGDPWYTVPFIHDQSTGVVMSESFDIVQYLDKQYPSTPRVITPGTLAFETAYYNYFQAEVRAKCPLCVYMHIYQTVSVESATWIRESRDPAPGDPTKDPQLQWDEFKDALGSVALPAYEKAEGIFLRGNEPAWADFVTAAAVLSNKMIYGGDSKEWKAIETWHSGRWAKLIKDLEPYSHIDE